MSQTNIQSWPIVILGQKEFEYEDKSTLVHSTKIGFSPVHIEVTIANGEFVYF